MTTQALFLLYLMRQPIKVDSNIHTHICFSSVLVLNHMPQFLRVYLILAYWAKLWFTEIIVLLFPNSLSTSMQLILSSDNSCFRTFAIDKANNSALHLFTALAFLWSTLAFLPVLCHSLPKAVPPTFLLQNPFFCKLRAKWRSTQTINIWAITTVCSLTLQLTMEKHKVVWRPPRSISNTEIRECSAQNSCAGAALSGRSTEMCRTASSYPLSFPGGFSGRKQPEKASEKVQRMQCDWGLYQ